MPTDWDKYSWPIINKEEIDSDCPYSEDPTKKHKEICDCFKAELVEGWKGNMEEKV